MAKISQMQNVWLKNCNNFDLRKSINHAYYIFKLTHMITHEDTQI